MQWFNTMAIEIFLEAYVYLKYLNFVCDKIMFVNKQKPLKKMT